MRLTVFCRSTAAIAAAKQYPITFGAAKRTKEGARLYTAEELVAGWRSLSFTKNTAGRRTYAFIGSLASIENALLQYAIDAAQRLQPSLTLVDVDDVLPLTTTVACGFPAPTDTERLLQYTLVDHPRLCLSGTAEMSIAHTFKERVFEANELPLWILAKSRCFRPEISKGAAEKKLYRVHEFNKVEMFAVCKPQLSNEVHHRLVEIQREIFASLELHCRIVDMPADDLGAAAARKFDVEAWMPGRERFGEISSASNCTDYQAQRLNIRYRADDGNCAFVHTCNGTALASTRTLIALLETHQNPKRKSVSFPDCLMPWLPLKRSPQVYHKPAISIAYPTSSSSEQTTCG